MFTEIAFTVAGSGTTNYTLTIASYPYMSLLHGESGRRCRRPRRRRRRRCTCQGSSAATVKYCSEEPLPGARHRASWFCIKIANAEFENIWCDNNLRYRAACWGAHYQLPALISLQAACSIDIIPGIPHVAALTCLHAHCTPIRSVKLGAPELVKVSPRLVWVTPFCSAASTVTEHSL